MGTNAAGSVGFDKINVALLSRDMELAGWLVQERVTLRFVYSIMYARGCRPLAFLEGTRGSLRRLSAKGLRRRRPSELAENGFFANELAGRLVPEYLESVCMATMLPTWRRA